MKDDIAKAFSFSSPNAPKGSPLWASGKKNRMIMEKRCDLSPTCFFGGWRGLDLDHNDKQGGGGEKKEEGRTPYLSLPYPDSELGGR